MPTMASSSATATCVVGEMIYVSRFNVLEDALRSN